MPSTPHPLTDARAQLAEAIQFLGFDDGMRRMLETARKEVTVAIPLRRDDGTMELHIGHRVQHNISRGPAKGGGSATGAQASSTITIRVADDGPGIPADIRDRVFDRFVRGDSSRTRDGRGSSGLGMSIVESLARAMGGVVRLVDSEKGTVIDVTLPAA